mgnify:CR=1 FL=1
MKKVVASLLLIGMAVSMAACGKSKSKNTFTVGFDQDFPPFGYVGDDGEYTGFDIEMATECAKRMGKEIVLQPIDWDAKDMELEAGTIDCIWNGFTVNGREDQYTWTDSYMDNTQVVVTKKDSGITTLDDLAGKIVEVQKESSAQTAKFQLEGKEDDYVILDDVISSEQYAVGFLKGNDALRDEVQDALMELVDDGTFAEISDKYFGYDVCTLK